MSTKSIELSNHLIDSYVQSPLSDLEFKSIYNSIPQQIASNLTQKEMLRYTNNIAKYIYETYATYDQATIELIMIDDHCLHHAFAFALWALPPNRFEHQSEHTVQANRLTKLQRRKSKASLAIEFISTLPRNYELASLVHPLTDIEVEAKYLVQIFGNQNSGNPDSQTTFNINRATLLFNELISSRSKEISKTLKELSSLKKKSRSNGPDNIPSYRESVSKFEELAERIEDPDVLAELRQTINDEFNKQFSNTQDLVMSTLVKHQEHFDNEDLAKWVTKALHSKNEISIMRALELLALSPTIYPQDKLVSIFDSSIKSPKKEKISNAALKQLPLLARVLPEQKIKEWLDYAFSRRRSLAVTVLSDIPLDFTPEILANWLEKSFKSSRSFSATIPAFVKLASKLNPEDLERFMALISSDRSTKSSGALIRLLPNLIGIANDDSIATFLAKSSEFEHYAMKLRALIKVYTHPDTSPYLRSKLEDMYKEHTAGTLGVAMYSDIARNYFLHGLEPSAKLLYDWSQSNDGHQRAIAQIITTGTIEDQVELALSRYSEISAEDQITRRFNALSFDNIFDTSKVPFKYPKIVDSIPTEIKTPNGDIYNITLPKDPIGLATNAKQMKNCSGGHHYVKALSDGSSVILILNPKTPISGIAPLEQTINAEYKLRNGVWVYRQVHGFNDGRPYQGRTARVPKELSKILQQDLETIINQFALPNTSISIDKGI